MSATSTTPTRSAHSPTQSPTRPAWRRAAPWVAAVLVGADLAVAAAVGLVAVLGR